MEPDAWRVVSRNTWSLVMIVLGAALVVPAWADDARRSGKAVRVERSRPSAASPIRFCPLMFGDEGKGLCFGSAPPLGATAHVFDYDESHLGTIRVAATALSERYPCHMDAAFDFEFTPLSGAIVQNTQAMGFAVFGVEPLSPNARFFMHRDALPAIADISPGEPSIAMDRDGNGELDLVLSSFNCTDIEPPPAATNGRQVETFCLDYWVLRGNTWRQVGRDRSYSCM